MLRQSRVAAACVCRESTLVISRNFGRQAFLKEFDVRRPGSDTTGSALVHTIAMLAWVKEPTG